MSNMAYLTKRQLDLYFAMRDEAALRGINSPDERELIAFVLRELPCTPEEQAEVELAKKQAVKKSAAPKASAAKSPAQVAPTPSPVAPAIPTPAKPKSPEHQTMIEVLKLVHPDLF